MKCFFLVLARSRNGVPEKIIELEKLKIPFLVICGERINFPNVIYRKPLGKYDAINFSKDLIPDDIDVVVYNDVDTKIHKFYEALNELYDKNVGLVFVKVLVREGPQSTFYRFLDSIRRRIPITASGEMMLIRHYILKKILPMEPCKAEDSYMLFSTLEQGHKAVFCENAYVETERTRNIEDEESYKRRTVSGLYQALKHTNPPMLIKVFFYLLPFVSPLLLISGKKGYYWTKGVLLGFVDFIRGDTRGHWQPTYTK